MKTTRFRRLAFGVALAVALVLPSTGQAETFVWEQRRDPFPPATGHAAAVFDPVRKELVVVGAEWGQPSSETWVWAGGAWTRRTPPVSPPALEEMAVAFHLGLGVVLLFGGRATNNTYVSNELWSWDGASWTKLASPSPPAPRAGHKMAYDPARNRLVVVGGANLLGPAFGTDVWEWDGANWTQGSGAYDLRGFGLTFDAVQQRPSMFGGWSTATLEWSGSAWVDVSPVTDICATSPGSSCCKACWLISPVSCSAPECATRQPPARGDTAATNDPTTGRPVIFGGVYASALFDDYWTWNGSVWTRDPAVGPPGRYGHALATHAATDSVFAFGGQANGYRNDLWRHNASGWTQLSAGTSGLGPRYGFPLVFDPLRAQTVLFGGSYGGGGYGGEDDTWTWDGSRWEKKALTTRPPARQQHAMAFDGARGRVVMYGGWKYLDSAITWFDDTWTWDGSAWTKLSPTTSPGARTGHAMAFDAARAEVLMFGGQTETGSGPNETWSWNGSTWTRLYPTHAPPGRSWHAMAYDSKRERVVLFGGSDGNGTSTSGLTDTWEWDGTQWTHRATAVSPAGIGPALGPSGNNATFDSVRKRVVLFGGGGSYDTWEYRSVGGPCTSNADCNAGECVAGACCETCGAAGGAPDAGPSTIDAGPPASPGVARRQATILRARAARAACPAARRTGPAGPSVSRWSPGRSSVRAFVVGVERSARTDRRPAGL